MSVVIPAGDGSGRQTQGRPAPTGPSDASRNPAQDSFWLLESAADAAMTYFYAQLFAMDAEIRAMFPAAMDVQRRRFFEALSHIAAAQVGRITATASFLICRNSARAPEVRRAGDHEVPAGLARRSGLCPAAGYAVTLERRPRAATADRRFWRTPSPGPRMTARSCRTMGSAYRVAAGRPGVSDEPAHDVMYGTVPELAARRRRYWDRAARTAEREAATPAEADHPGLARAVRALGQPPAGTRPGHRTRAPIRRAAA